MAYVPNYSTIGQYKGKVLWLFCLKLLSRFSRVFGNREILTHALLPNYSRIEDLVASRLLCSYTLN